MLFHIYLTNKILGIRATSIQDLRVNACKEFWQNKRTHNYREVFYWLDERKKHMLMENAVDFLHCLEQNKKKDFIKIHFAFIAKESCSESPSSMTYAAIHINSTCKYCEIAPIVGERYLCAGWPSYNLCEICEEFEVHSTHRLVDETLNPNEDLRNSLLMLEKPPTTTLDEFIRTTLQNVNKKIDRQNQLVVVMSQILTNNVNIMAKMSEALCANGTELNETITNQCRATESTEHRPTQPTSCSELNANLSEEVITTDERGLRSTTSMESLIDKNFNSDEANKISQFNSTIVEPHIEVLWKLMPLPPNSNMEYCHTMFETVESAVSELKSCLEPGPTITEFKEKSYSKLTLTPTTSDIGVKAKISETEDESFSNLLYTTTNWASRAPVCYLKTAQAKSYTDFIATKLKREEAFDSMIKSAESNSSTSFEDKPLSAITNEATVSEDQAASSSESGVKQVELLQPETINEFSFQFAYDKDELHEESTQSSINEHQNEEACALGRQDKASQTYLDFSEQDNSFNFEIINMQDSAMSATQLLSTELREAVGTQPGVALVDIPPSTKLKVIDCSSREGSSSSIELIDDEP